MKWKDIFLIVFESVDDLSWKTSLALHQRYHIPMVNIAVFQRDNIHRYKGFLNRATRESKIIILAHGTADYIDASPLGNMNAIEFLIFIHDILGLREAGIITFKSCMIGSGQFLNKCAGNAGLLFDSFKVGWWKGYKGISATHFMNETCFFSSGEDDYYLRKKTNGRDKLPSNLRIEIVKGNIIIPLP